MSYGFKEMSEVEMKQIIKLLISQRIPNCGSSYFLRKLIFSKSTWDVYEVFELLLEQFPELHLNPDVKRIKEVKENYDNNR